MLARYTLHPGTKSEDKAAFAAAPALEYPYIPFIRLGALCGKAFSGFLGTLVPHFPSFPILPQYRRLMTRDFAEISLEKCGEGLILSFPVGQYGCTGGSRA